MDRHWDKNGTNVGEQLYDAARDPYQVDDLTADPAYENVAERMKPSAAQSVPGNSACVLPGQAPVPPDPPQP